MVGPARRWNIHGFGGGIEALEEGAADAQCASAGNGLRDGDAVFVHRRGVWAVGQEHRGFGEAGYAGYAGVFFVEGSIDNFPLGFFDRWEDVGFSLVVSVCADT